MRTEWFDGTEALRNETIHKDGLEKECVDAVAEIAGLTVDIAKNKRQHRALETKMLRVLAGSVSTGRSTPRPEWDDVAEKVDASLELETVQLRTVDVVKQLTEHLAKGNVDLRQNLEKIASTPQEQKEAVSARLQSKQPEEEKWHICRGTGPKIPKFLQRVGRVRNMSLSKRQTETLVSDFWAAKIKNDSQPEAVVDRVSDFLYAFLVERCGGHGPAVEMGYNLADGLKRHSYDADCELFGRIVHGELCEAAYHEQMEHINGFIQCCADADAAELDGLQESDGMLGRSVFLDCVDKYFSIMHASELRALKKALSYQFPLTPEIPYRELFEDDDQGNQGKFAETMRDEHMYVLMQEYPSAENNIRKAVIESLQAKPKITSLTDLDAKDWPDYQKAMETVPLLSGFTGDSMKKLMKESKFAEFNDGDHIIVQATAASLMYVVLS